MSSQTKWKLLAVLIVASAILGVVGWQQFAPKPVPPATTTVATAAVTTSIETQTTKQPSFRLYGKVFFDYNGNGKQDRGEPDIPNVVVALNGENVTATNSTGWYVIEEVPRGMNTIRPFPTKNFRYMCESASEFRPVEEPYRVLVLDDARKDIGLMEGFLTMPFVKGTGIRAVSYHDDNYCEWNPSSNSRAKDWMGGQQTYEGHKGTDYGIERGTQILAAAPGEVMIAQYEEGKDLDPNVLLYHGWHNGNHCFTAYAHMSRVDVKVGQRVRRGDQIGLSGPSQSVPSPGPHLHFQLNLAPSIKGWDGRFHRDPYRAIWDPTAVSYWTKDNDPQYPDTKLSAPTMY